MLLTPEIILKWTKDSQKKSDPFGTKYLRFETNMFAAGFGIGIPANHSELAEESGIKKDIQRLRDTGSKDIDGGTLYISKEGWVIKPGTSIFRLPEQGTESEVITLATFLDICKGLSPTVIAKLAAEYHVYKGSTIVPVNRG